METLIINGEENKYVGSPLIAFILEDDLWSGRCNFLASNQKIKTRVDLENLNDSFNWMKKWTEEGLHQGAYVLDFSTRTIYYENEETLTHLKEKKIPGNKWDGYFESFIQKDFSK